MVQILFGGICIWFEKGLINYFLNSTDPMKLSPKRVGENVSNFIEKTFSILEDDGNSDIVEWSPSGSSFIIRDLKKFEESILPAYFKHSNFSSFVRQLNMYNFHKVRGDRQDCEFEHEKFKRGHRQLLPQIKRKQSESLIISTNNFEEPVGALSQHAESQEGRKHTLHISSGSIKEQITHKDQAQELKDLREQNKELRKTREQKLEEKKLLMDSSPVYTGQKFFKLVTALLAEKIQRQMHIVKDYSEADLQGRSCSFEEIMENILNGSIPESFKEYSLTVEDLTKKQTNYEFMIKTSQSRK